ncbi:MAG: hypothetical protein PHN31_05100 [Candidatus Gracilibacteria bacterium]|nr:hypothetical protein [Candidatus Gracilibacteria bacterium]
MQQLAPLMGYYGFLLSMLGLGLFFIYGVKYLKKKKEEKEKELLGK